MEEIESIVRERGIKVLEEEVVHGISRRLWPGRDALNVYNLS